MQKNLSEKEKKAGKTNNNKKYTATSDDNGEYTFKNLFSRGPYTLTVEKEGYDTYVIDDYMLDPDNSAESSISIDIKNPLSGQAISVTDEEDAEDDVLYVPIDDIYMINFHNYIDKVLIPKYGIVNPYQTTVGIDKDNKLWPSFHGLYSALLDDLDNDGQKELLIFRDYCYIEVYEYDKNNEFVLQDSIKLFDDANIGKNEYEYTTNYHLSIVNTPKNHYILSEYGSYKTNSIRFADWVFKALTYDGNTFNYVFGIDAVHDNMWYMSTYENIGDKPIESEDMTVDTMNDWFDKYGIILSDNIKLSYDHDNKGILSDSNKITKIMDYTIEPIDFDSNNPYEDFDCSASLIDYTGLIEYSKNNK